jgi:CheY-like chemotaxis protein
MLLVDLKMPKKSGFVVIRWLRSKPAFSSLPTVVLTSSDADPDIKKAYTLGPNSYLVKPLSAQQLIDLAKAFNWSWLQRAQSAAAAPKL